MPNIPAEIGCGVVGTIFNQDKHFSPFAKATPLLMALGEIVSLETEDQMHALTAVSGSGPAYVFAMAEALEEAALALGLPDKTARKLSIQTIFGSGNILAQGKLSPEELRKLVCSPGGTTEAGLNVLLNKKPSLFELVQDTVKAAEERSIELSKKH